MTICMLIINICLITLGVSYLKSTKSTIKALYSTAEDYTTLHTSLSYSIQIDGRNVSDINLFDIQGNEIKIVDILNNKGSVVICRLSDRYCNTCVKNAISVFTGALSESDTNHVVFFAETTNSKTLRMFVNEYGIEQYKVFNVHQFHTIAEQATFPYFFVVDSSCHILSTYFPSKTTRSLDSSFVKKLLKRVNKFYE